MATSNKMMSDMLRNKRREQLDYMYRAGETADVAADPEADPAELPAPTFEVKDAGQPDDSPESFIYEPFVDAPGAWVVYPPGVPCDQEERRVVLDHPATSEELDRMSEAIDQGGKTKPKPEPESPVEDKAEGYLEA